MESTLLDFRTDQRFTDLTDRVAEFCAGRGDGLVNVFAPHATAGLALFETGAGSEPDAADMLDRLVPRDDRYVHRHGSPGHGADHLVPILVAPALTLPVVDGVPALGTWQSIVFVDPNVDNPSRKVRLSFIPG